MIVFFNFLILCQGLAYKEEFIIKWQQVVRTCLNIKKNRFKNVNKLKSKSKWMLFFGENL